MTKNIECWGTDEVVCPHCGYEYSDSQEFIKDNNPDIGKITCDGCGLEFKCEGEYSVVYYSEKIKVVTPTVDTFGLFG